MNGRNRGRGGFTLIELLVVIAIIGVLIALLLPAVQSAREAARRAQCANNLMQLSIALQNYQSAHEALPPGVVDVAGPIRNVGKGYHFGWVPQVLPYIEQGNIQNHLNFKVDVYHPANDTARAVSIKTLMCPSDPGAFSYGGPSGGMVPPGITPAAGPPAGSSYAGCYHDIEAPINTNNAGVLFLNSRIRDEDVKDGLSNTIFLGEHVQGSNSLGWASGTSSTLRNTGTTPGGSARVGVSTLYEGEAEDPVAAEIASPPVGGFGSFHPGGANFAFGDGSVHFLRGSISPRIFRFLGNRADGEMIGADQF